MLLSNAASKELKLLEKEREKISFIKQSMKDCKSITDNMLDVVGAMEETISSLEEKILPIHKSTRALHAAEANISSVLAATEECIKHTNVASATEEEVSSRSIHTNPSIFLEWVDSLHAATVFFRRNEFVKGGDRCLRKLKELNKRVLEQMQNQFLKLGEKCFQTQLLDAVVATRQWPLEEAKVQELGNKADIAGMAAIAKRMDMIGDRSTLLKEGLEDPMSQAMKLCLKRIVHEQINIGNNGELFGIGGESKAVSDTIVGRYRKGSHPSIFFIQFFLKLMELQRELMNDILVQTDMTENQINDSFIATVSLPLEYFLRHCAEFLKERGVNRLVRLLDTMTTIKELSSAYYKAYPVPEAENPFRQLKFDVKRETQRAVSEYCDYVRHYNAVTKQQKRMKDGSIYNLTIETISYIKSLHTYAEIIKEAHIKAHIIEEKKETDKDYLGDNKKMDAQDRLTNIILHALEANLEARAKDFKSKSRAAIFLVNNFHYIGSCARRGEIQVDEDFISASSGKVRRQMNAYITATWFHILRTIDEEEAKELRKAALENVGKVKKQIKSKFLAFNEHLKETRDRHCNFSVPDPDIKSQIKQLNESTVVQPYIKFRDLFLDIPFTSTDKKKMDQYIIYDGDAVRAKLKAFFEESSQG